jgi:lipopolysaccharide export LptBFGC system permease protein LptF
LSSSVPVAMLYSKDFWAVLYGVLPLEVYLALPAGVAIAVTWQYAQLASDNVFEVLYSARYSPRAIIMPGLLIALLGTALGLFISCVLAPYGQAFFFDAVYDFEHRLRPANLTAQKFLHLNEGRTQRTLYFERWLGDDTVGTVLLSEITPDEEMVVAAKSGRFIVTEHEALLHFFSGVLEITRRGEARPLTMNFDSIVKSIGLRGSTRPVRDWLGMSELGPLRFLKRLTEVKDNPAEMAKWASEAVKRFATPFLAVICALFGMGLVLHGSGARRETRWKAQAIFLVLILNYAAIVVAADAVSGLDAKLAWAIVAVIVIQAIVALGIAFLGMFVGRGFSTGIRNPRST